MGRSILAGTADGVIGLGPDSKALSGHDVRAIVRGKSHYFCIVDAQEIRRSNAGANWEKIVTFRERVARSLLPIEGGLLIGTAEPHLFRWKEGASGLEVVSGFDTAPGRDEWHNVGGNEPEVRSLSGDPGGPYFANVHVGGILRSTDGGHSWQPTIDVNADVHQVLFDPSSGSLLAACAIGLAVSEDSGASWRFHTEGLHAPYLRAVTATLTYFFVTASTGPFTQHAAIYRISKREGRKFEHCSEGLPARFPSNINTYCLTATEGGLVFGTAEGQVFHSDDEGSSWTLVGQGLPAVRCVALT